MTVGYWLHDFCTTVVQSASNCHLMQLVAWRCPDLGLNPTTCVAEPANMRHDRGREYPCRSFSTAASKTRTSKEGFNQPFFEKKKYVSHPPNRDTKSQATRKTQITNQLMSCTSQQQ